MESDGVRVLVADDHPVFRDGLQVLLSSVPEMEVIGEAATGGEAVRLADELQPDVVLMDLRMPETNGIEATRQIVRASPHIAVLVLTMSEDDDSVFAAMRVGARGYLLKGADQTEMLRAIRAVASGEAIFGPGIAQRLMNYFVARPLPADQQLFPEITEREYQILRRMARGENNAAIADRGLSSKRKPPSR